MQSAVVVPIGRIHHVKCPDAGAPKCNLAFVLDPITLKNLFDVGKHRLEGLLADDIHNDFSNDILRTKSKHLTVSFADEVITQVAAAARQQKRSSTQHGRDCTRTTLSWRARSIGSLKRWMALPIVSEVGVT